MHQENTGLNVEMEKLAFSKGKWSYMCKMDASFHKYSFISHPQLSSLNTIVTLMQKVPSQLKTTNGSTDHSFKRVFEYVPLEEMDLKK